MSANAHPNARVELFDLATQEMLAGLESDKLDVAVTVGQQHKTRGLVWTPLARRAKVALLVRASPTSPAAE